MKTFASLALAGALAATSIAATASGASAGGWQHRNGYGPYHNGPYPHATYAAPNDGGALFAGAILGLTFGLMASELLAEPAPAPPVVYHQFAGSYAGPGDDHVAWCSQTYRSYDARSDTFRDFRGVVRQCVEPYQ